MQLLRTIHEKNMQDLAQKEGRNEGKEKGKEKKKRKKGERQNSLIYDL